MKTEIKMDESIKRVGEVRKAIVKKHEKEIAKGIDVLGEMKCPYCKGKIRYSMANSYNGHIWASCENKCVEWME